MAGGRVSAEKYGSDFDTWKTHDWTKGMELPMCKKCKESPISLGF